MTHWLIIPVYLLAGRLLPGGKDEVVQVQRHGAEADEAGLQDPEDSEPLAAVLAQQPHTLGATQPQHTDRDINLQYKM